jgi:hypothetical protein
VTRKRHALLTLVALVLAGALFGAFHLLYEKVERAVKTPPTGRAAVDPYYAAELVLASYGLEVRQAAESSAELDEAYAVFWFAEAPPGPDVWDFHHEGGLVIVGERHYDAFYEEMPEAEADAREPAGLRFFDDEGGGEGLLAVVPDVSIFTTARLREPGHVEALAEIAEELEPGDVVVIVRRVASTHLLGLIFGRGLPAVVALLVFLALLGRRSALRLGPVLAATEPGRRSFVEHLEAVGHFARRRGGEDALVESARAEVLERFVRRRPELAGLRGEALVERLLERVTLDRETLSRALVVSPRGHPRAFVDFVNALQELRKST